MLSKCSFEGCSNLLRLKKFYLCKQHYRATPLRKRINYALKTIYSGDDLSALVYSGNPFMEMFKQGETK